MSKPPVIVVVIDIITITITTNNDKFSNNNRLKNIIINELFFLNHTARFICVYLSRVRLEAKKKLKEEKRENKRKCTSKVAKVFLSYQISVLKFFFFNTKEVIILSQFFFFPLFSVQLFCAFFVSSNFFVLHFRHIVSQ